jgi:hypothetical protein
LTAHSADMVVLNAKLDEPLKKDSQPKETTQAK